MLPSLLPIYSHLPFKYASAEVVEIVFLVQNDERIVYINNALRQALETREFWGAPGVLVRNHFL